MERSLTLNGVTVPRILSFVWGLGMIVASIMTIDHYFAANFPETIFEGSFCDINAFFNCDASAYSEIASIGGIPLGYFGVFVGGLLALGALFPSAAFERSNKSISLLNAVGIVTLVAYSVFVLKSLCLLCTGFYVSGLLSFAFFWKYGIDGDAEGFFSKWIQPSPRHLATFAVILSAGGFGFSQFNDAKADAQSGGVQTRIVDQFFNLPVVENPSFLSPFWTIRSTEEFTDAPIQIVEWGDLLCPDCKLLADQLHELEAEYRGQMNVAYQYFPLEAVCNDVVEKDLHAGACEISYMSAHDPESFVAIHDEIQDAWPESRQPEWRQEMAQRYGVQDGATDPETQALVHRIIQTGKEYEQTSDRFSYGIRSTPSMIINGRLVIGTFPLDQMRAIFDALVAQAQGSDQFLENWVER